MQNNEQVIIDFKETLNNMASLLTQQEVKCIKVSEPLFTYMSYFLKDDIIYERGEGSLPIGYMFGVPIEIDKNLQGFNWKPIYRKVFEQQDEKGMRR